MSKIDRCIGPALLRELKNPNPVRLVRAARELRRRHFRGAVLYELLGLVRFRRPQELRMARSLAARLSVEDLYPTASMAIRLPGEDHWIHAASWILHHEIANSDASPPEDPGLRLQSLAFLHAALEGEKPDWRTLRDLLDTLELPASEKSAWKAAALLKAGNLSEAFVEVKAALRIGGEKPMVRKIGAALFRKVPLNRRLDFLFYSRHGSIRNIGVSPFPGLGFLAKEYTASDETSSRLFSPEAPRYPEVRVLDWAVFAELEGRASRSQLETFLLRKIEPSLKKEAA